jgi:hypothetical protein
MEYLAYAGPIWAAPVIPIPISFISKDWNNFLLPRSKKIDSFDAGIAVPTTEDTQTWTGATTRLITNFKRRAKKGKGKAKQAILQHGIELDHVPLIERRGERRVDGDREGVGRGKKRVASTSVASTSVAEWALEQISKKRRRYLPHIFGRGSMDREENGETRRPKRGRYEALPVVFLNESQERPPRGSCG